MSCGAGARRGRADGVPRQRLRRRRDAAARGRIADRARADGRRVSRRADRGRRRRCPWRSRHPARAVGRRRPRRAAHRIVRRRRTAGCGRDGRGLPGARRGTRPRRRDQGAAVGDHRRPRSAPALRARGPRARLAEPSAHRGDLRHRADRRCACARARARRRRDARGADRGTGPARGRGRGDRQADRGRARRGARAGHHPPRSEAGQRQDHAGRSREGAGLRSGQSRRVIGLGSLVLADAHAQRYAGRRRHGNGRLHEPGTGPRPCRRQADRHLGVRLRAVRAPDGSHGLQRCDRVRLHRGHSGARARLERVAGRHAGGHPHAARAVLEEGSDAAARRHGGRAVSARRAADAHLERQLAGGGVGRTACVAKPHGADRARERSGRRRADGRRPVDSPCCASWGPLRHAVRGRPSCGTDAREQRRRPRRDLTGRHALRVRGQRPALCSCGRSAGTAADQGHERAAGRTVLFSRRPMGRLLGERTAEEDRHHGRPARAAVRHRRDSERRVVER